MENKEKKLLGLLLKISLENKAKLDTLIELQSWDTLKIQELLKPGDSQVQSFDEIKSIYQRIYESRYKENKALLEFDLDDYLSKAHFFA